MSVTKWKVLFHIIIILIIFFSGFFTGRSSLEDKVIIKTEYEKGDTITNTIEKLVPNYIEKPIDTLEIITDCIKNGIYQELWPEKTIKEFIEMTSEDTLKIVNDWASKRFYEELLFQSDTLGNCKIKMEIQYNRLNYLHYQYEPISKNIIETKYIVKTFSPFIGIGYLSNPWDIERNPIINLTGGIFIKEKIGIQANLMHMLKSKNDYIGGTILLKF